VVSTVGVLVVSDMLTWMHARSFDGSARARVRLMGFYCQLCSCPTVVVPEAIAIPPLWLDPANAQRAPVRRATNCKSSGCSHAAQRAWPAAFRYGRVPQ
jgi:hypothetical protein